MMSKILTPREQRVALRYGLDDSQLSGAAEE